MSEVKPWAPSRAYKGKRVDIYIRSAGKVDMFPEKWDSPEAAWTMFDPVIHSITDEDGIGVHTDARYGSHIERRYMVEGVATGLEERRDHLPGRCLLAKALGLAVHLGASSAVIYGAVNLGPRERRNIATMVRPLKGHRVRVFDADNCLGLFPPFGLEE